MNNSSCVLPNLYLPSVDLFCALANYQTLQLDASDIYQKQTYRNRCNIIGANGIQTLTVPVVNGHSMGMRFKDVRIAYDTRWQQIHWRSISAAYKSSPFFEYYEDDFVGFYTKQHTFLFEYNAELLRLILQLLDFSKEKQVVLIDVNNQLTDNDLRLLVNCKQSIDTSIPQPPYWQVFNDRHSFTPHLSILDLLFNMGTESYLYLEGWGRAFVQKS